MPFNELTGGFCVLSEVWDHTAFRCSGSGAREGDSFNPKAFGDFDHWDAKLVVCWGGVDRPF